MSSVTADTPLRPRQQRFVDAYVDEPNGTQAAIAAGYSAKTAGQMANENLKKPNIAAAIEIGLNKKRKVITEKTDITAADVVRELSYLGFSDVGDVFNFVGDQLEMKPPSEIPESARRAIQSIKVRRIKGQSLCEVVELKFADKRASLELIGRHLGIFAERPPVSPVSVNVFGNVELSKLDDEQLASLSAILDAAKSAPAAVQTPAGR